MKDSYTNLTDQLLNLMKKLDDPKNTLLSDAMEKKLQSLSKSETISYLKFKISLFEEKINKLTQNFHED